MTDQTTTTGNLATQTRDIRTRIAVGAARGAHVFDRTLLTGPSPMPPATVETNLMAHFATTYGFALAEVLRIVEEHGDTDLLQEVVGAVDDIGQNGDDGRSFDIWPLVEAKLAEGGVGTAQWDEQRLTPNTSA